MIRDLITDIERATVLLNGRFDALPKFQHGNCLKGNWVGELIAESSYHTQANDYNTSEIFLRHEFARGNDYPTRRQARGCNAVAYMNRLKKKRGVI